MCVGRAIKFYIGGYKNYPLETVIIKDVKD